MSRHLTVPIKPQGNVANPVAAETITDRQVVAVDGSGQAIVASKNDQTKVNVLGFAKNGYSAAETTTIQTTGLIDGFTGLDDGQPVYLGDTGAITQNHLDVAIDEYRVFLGFAISTTEIYISLQEATLNSATSSLVSALMPRVYNRSADFTMVQSDMSYTHTSVYLTTGATDLTCSVVASPSTSYIGAKILIKKVDSGSGKITITNHGLSYTLELSSIDCVAVLEWNGVNWELINYEEYGDDGSGNHWEKLADGTMEQWGSVSGSTSASTTSWFGSTSGTIYYYTEDIIFPKTFTVSPNISLGAGDAAGVRFFNLAVGQFRIALYDSTNGGVSNGDWHAIGRWK